MSYKYHESASDRFPNTRSATTPKSYKRVVPKKVVLSKKLGECSEKSCSTGIIRTGWNTNSRPRKTTKSDLTVSTKYHGKTSIDYCKKCGDTVASLNGSIGHSTRHKNSLISLKDDTEITFKSQEENGSRNGRALSRTNSRPSSVKQYYKNENFKMQDDNGSRNGRSKTIQNGTASSLKTNCQNFKILKDDSSRNGRSKTRENGKVSSVKQYYKNENFQSTESLHETENEFRKMSLDTIKEVPETYMASDKLKSFNDNVFEIYSDPEEIGFLDTNDAENIEDLKDFRRNNYFECHSAKSRVENKGSVTSLRDHKCVYRFYLNDRLFPVPLSSDHHNNVRCVECHLPIDLKIEMDGSDSANGTIQAKVKLNKENEAQDMILFLPVKDSLIIKERRKQIKAEEEVMYFGVIKLDTYGHSVFKSTLPTDSLALKYQKGYKEFENIDSYKYKGVEQDDVIII